MISSDKPFEVIIPEEINISDFQKLVTLKILREECLIQGITQYVQKALGP